MICLQRCLFIIPRLQVLMNEAHSLFIHILSTQLATNHIQGAQQMFAESMGGSGNDILLASESPSRVRHQIEIA